VAVRNWPENSRFLTIMLLLRRPSDSSTINDRTITMASNIRLILGDQLRELDDATIFQILSPSGYFYSADLFRSSLRLEPTYCPPCRRFLHNPAPMFRQWWVDEAAGGMRMPTQWHEIHSMKELQAYAALGDEGPEGQCPLCVMIWEQATRSTSPNIFEVVVRDHTDAPCPPLLN